MSAISTLTPPWPKQQESYINLLQRESVPDLIARPEFARHWWLSLQWPEAVRSLDLWEKPAEPTPSSIAIEVENLLESLQRQHVYLRNINLILDYLHRSPDLIDVIGKAVSAAQKYFPDAQLVMSVYQDPEIDDRYITIYVRLKQYNDSIIDKLEKAETEFLDDLADKEGWLQLTTDFREPEEEDVL